MECPRDENSIGKVLDNIIVEIIDNEIQVSGPNVMIGYWNQPEQSNDVLVHRDNKIWYKTGDSGYLENDFLYYTGRINDNYKLSNGKFVNVDETEAIIKKYINGMVIVCGENQDRNDIITDHHITSQIKEQINVELDHYLHINTIYYLPTDEWAPFLTPKLSIKRKLLINHMKP